MSDDDPARQFLDQTVPRLDEPEPLDGPARPRHVQDPAHPPPTSPSHFTPLSKRERRANALRRAAWSFGPSAAFLAGAALSEDEETSLERPDDAGVGDDLSAGYGEAGSGW